MKDIYKALATPEKNGGDIGWFRALCAVFGGLAVAYSAMTLLVLLPISETAHALFIPFLFTPFAWACTALWISLSPTRFGALLRSLVPTFVFFLAAAVIV